MSVRTEFVSGIGRLLSRLNGRDQVEYVREVKLLTDFGGFKSVPFQESGTASLATFK